MKAVRDPLHGPADPAYHLHHLVGELDDAAGDLDAIELDVPAYAIDAYRMLRIELKLLRRCAAGFAGVVSGGGTR